MKTSGLKTGLLIVFVAATGAASVFLHRQNERGRRRLADLRAGGRSTTALHEDNARLRALVQATTAGHDATEAIHAAVEQARAEVAKLERMAAVRHAELAAEAASDQQALANNRDPNAGLTRLEYFQNVGRATPRAACQTLVWAALKGDEAALNELSVLSAVNRERAEELIATLPEAERTRWTPEKIAALYLSAVVTDVSAAEIGAEELTDAGHAWVTLRIPHVDEAKSKLELRASAAGWQVVLPENAIDVMRRKIAAPAK
jgi:hypothetical protein